jgi:hypothetical protein
VDNQPFANSANLQISLMTRDLTAAVNPGLSEQRWI